MILLVGAMTMRVPNAARRPIRAAGTVRWPTPEPLRVGLRRAAMKGGSRDRSGRGRAGGPDEPCGHCEDRLPDGDGPDRAWSRALWRGSRPQVQLRRQDQRRLPARHRRVRGLPRNGVDCRACWPPSGLQRDLLSTCIRPGPVRPSWQSPSCVAVGRPARSGFRQPRRHRPSWRRSSRCAPALRRESATERRQRPRALLGGPARSRHSCRRRAIASSCRPGHPSTSRSWGWSSSASILSAWASRSASPPIPVSCAGGSASRATTRLMSPACY